MTIYSRLNIALLALTVLLLHPLYSTAADLPLPDDPHIVVNGYGMVEQVPDIIVLSFEVSAVKENFSAAKDTVDAIIAKAVVAARDQGIEDDKINASKINAAPQYEWQNKNRVYKGERISRQVQLTLNEAERYNALVDGLLAAGISRLQPVKLDFSQRDALENKALNLALDDAKNKAQSMAKHVGTKVKAVFQIAPVDQGRRYERMAMSADMAGNEKKAGLKLGRQSIEQRIRVVYLLQ
ncbi:SIMPL domain-containing protein [Oceanicoccus sagamiensis]|uniref:SIMPL domain-containing protein n=1 Tax=Oceanicoccus sagamiensis TaxID=716816 RepID=A0A1X9NAG7_9GAMM|nr:SIMPL domain-containing protein [Oceanicoccus sagamiensis]ARN74054.1 hypothetical protein BST96_07935 [Oceanicoccus sagamiensis]